MSCEKNSDLVIFRTADKSQFKFYYSQNYYILVVHIIQYILVLSIQIYRDLLSHPAVKASIGILVNPCDKPHGDKTKPEWRIEAHWPGKCGIICIGYYGDTELEIRKLWDADPYDRNYVIQQLQKLDPVSRRWELVYPPTE